RTMWISGHTDLSRLLRNTVNWLLREERPVTIEGSGLIETFAWETQPGYAVHLLNYTNPNAHRGWVREFYRIGEQKVRMKLPEGKRISRVELLKAETEVPFRKSGTSTEFTIPGVLDYEVAALHA